MAKFTDQSASNHLEKTRLFDDNQMITKFARFLDVIFFFLHFSLEATNSGEERGRGAAEEEREKENRQNE